MSGYTYRFPCRALLLILNANLLLRYLYGRMVNLWQLLSSDPHIPYVSCEFLCNTFASDFFIVSYWRFCVHLEKVVKLLTFEKLCRNIVEVLLKVYIWKAFPKFKPKPITTYDCWRRGKSFQHLTRTRTTDEFVALLRFPDIITNSNCIIVSSDFTRKRK